MNGTRYFALFDGSRSARQVGELRCCPTALLQPVPPARPAGRPNRTGKSSRLTEGRKRWQRRKTNIYICTSSRRLVAERQPERKRLYGLVEYRTRVTCSTREAVRRIQYKCRRAFSRRSPPARRAAARRTEPSLEGHSDGSLSPFLFFPRWLFLSSLWPGTPVCRLTARVSHITF